MYSGKKRQNIEIAKIENQHSFSEMRSDETTHVRMD